MEFYYVILVVTGGLCLWGAISPMGMWRGTMAWRYADPEPHRPSESQNTLTRVVCVIALIVIIVAFPMISSLSAQNERRQEDYERQQKEDAYENCLDENDDTDGLLTAEDWCENLSPEPEES